MVSDIIFLKYTYNLCEFGSGTLISFNLLYILSQQLHFSMVTDGNELLGVKGPPTN